MKVPVELQGVLGKKELRYSLKTGYLGLAKSKARILAGQFQELFNNSFQWYAVGEFLSDSPYIISFLVHGLSVPPLCFEMVILTIPGFNKGFLFHAGLMILGLVF